METACCRKRRKRNLKSVRQQATYLGFQIRHKSGKSSWQERNLKTKKNENAMSDKEEKPKKTFKLAGKTDVKWKSNKKQILQLKEGIRKLGEKKKTE